VALARVGGWSVSDKVVEVSVLRQVASSIEKNCMTDLVRMLTFSPHKDELGGISSLHEDVAKA
jgi:hypothetical protein